MGFGLNVAGGVGGLQFFRFFGISSCESCCCILFDVEVSTLKPNINYSSDGW